MKPILQSLGILVCILLSNTSMYAQWPTVGAKGFSDGGTSFNSIAIDNANTPYVAYVDLANSDKITVKKYSNSAWSTVGAQAFSANRVKDVNIAVSSANVPFVVYSDLAYNYKLVAQRFDGNTWTDIGLPGFTGDRADYVSFALDANDVPYVAFSDYATNKKLTVMKYDGSNWVTVGSTGISAGEAIGIDLAIDNNNTPYIIYKDLGNSSLASVIKYTGNAWVTVGNAGLDFAVGSNQLTITTDATGTPFVSHATGGNGDSRILMYNGTNWVVAGHTGFSAGAVQQPSLTTGKNGVVYMVYSDAGLAEALTVVKYNGSYLAHVTPEGFTPTKADYPSIALDNENTPYVSFRDYSFGMNAKASVMKYDYPYAKPVVQTCAVTTDASTGKNIILWEHDASKHIYAYRIYRDDNGSYTYLGSTLATSAASFTDLNADPQAFSYTYKLTAVDSNDREMVLDSAIAHTTTRLRFERLDFDAAELSWNMYAGKPVDSIVIKRSNNNGPFEKIGNANITDITFRDKNIPAGVNQYRLETYISGGCNVNGSTTYSYITSNTATAWNTRVADATTDKLNIYPNPATNVLNIHNPIAIQQVMVYDMMGKVVMNVNVQNTTTATINVTQLPKAMYVLKIVSEGDVTTTSHFQKQ